MKKLSRPVTFLAVAVVAIVVLAIVLSNRGPSVEDLTFSELEDAIASGEIVEATILDSSHQIEGTLSSGELFRSTFPEESTDEIFAELRSAEPEIALEVDTEDGNLIIDILLSLLPLLIICLLYTSPSPRDATLSRMPSSA